jgi:hypothetical protein
MLRTDDEFYQFRYIMNYIEKVRDLVKSDFSYLIINSI